jgi:CO dehydrogenase/acetyl-CoA synthase beta subunit
VFRTFYATDGTIVEVDTTYSDLDELEPGQSLPFKMMPSVAGADVAEYRLQAQP